MKTRRPEEELLLRCARVPRDAEKADHIGALLREDVDWDYLLRMASRHSMMPLLHWHLGGVFPEKLPKSILEHLQDYFHRNSLRNLSLTGELLKLLRVFEEHGVPAIPYKGPVLAASVYGNLALREFIDLDVLVRGQDIAKARELLASLGYRQEELLAEHQEMAFLRSQREYVYSRDGAVVELHWAVTPRNYAFPLDPKSLWKRLEKVHLGGDTVLTFSLEDLLLILCVHGSKHFWHRLAWICDVAELLCVHEARIDWEQIIDQAGSLGSKRMLFLGLFLASDLLEAPLPEKVLGMVWADPEVKTLAREVRGWLFQETDEQPGILAKGQLDESRFHPFRVRMRERWRDKVRYCAHTALIPTVEDWVYLPLPKPLFPLYYAVRPVRLAGKYCQRLWERMLR